MKKSTMLLATAMFAMAMGTVANADDVTVRTSVGSGEITFVETDEPVQVSAEELTDMVRNAVKELADADVSGFFDASVDGKLDMGEMGSMAIKASAIGDAEKYGDASHVKVHYDYDLMGQADSGDFETYAWKEDGTNYTGYLSDGEWAVYATDAMEDAFDAVDEAEEKTEDFVLSGLQERLYASEDGRKCYVCVYGADEIKEAMGQVEDAAEYADAFDAVAGDADFSIVVVIDAETGRPRCCSIDAAGVSGTIPGEMLGGEGEFAYSFDEFYATGVLEPMESEIEIPDEVKAAYDENSSDDLNFDLSELGIETE